MGRELWDAPAEPGIWTTSRQDYGAKCRVNLLCSIGKLYTAHFWDEPKVWSFSRKITSASDGKQQEPKGESSPPPPVPSLRSSRIWNIAQHMLILSNFCPCFSIWVVLSIPSFTPLEWIQRVHWVFHHIIKPLDKVPKRRITILGVLCMEQVPKNYRWILFPQGSLVLSTLVHRLPYSFSGLGKPFFFQHLLDSFYSLASHKECSKLKAFSSHIRDTFAEPRYF